jgi:peptidoglycan/xylan/chitin deacetylase (PgdA/CDA1 family)
MYLKRCIFGTAEVGQLNALSRKLYGQSLAVLCYHGVVEADRSSDRVLYRNTVSLREFESQLEYLAKRFTPISAADLITALTQGKPVQTNSVVVTFDDGYRNNFTHAAPILYRKGIPAVFNLTTDYIGRNSILWTDEILFRMLDWPEAMLNAPVGSFDLPEPAAWAERFRVARGISQACKRIPVDSRNEFLALLRTKTPPTPSRYDSEAHDFMNWAQARQLAGQGFDLGSHTVSHPILTGVSGEQLTYELAESRAIIERETRSACVVIAYPNGSPDDYSQEVMQEAEKAGYRVAFSVEDRHAGRTPPRFAVPRLAVPGHVPLPIFYSKVSGLYALLGHGR